MYFRQMSAWVRGMENMPERGSFASLFSRKLVAHEERMDKGERGEGENI